MVTEFKVGDWVRVYNIIESSEYLSLVMEEEVIRGKTVQTDKYRNLLNSSYLTVESWQPKKGEFVARKFGINSFIVGMYGTEGFTENVEPFIGELHSSLKDKQCRNYSII